MTRIVLLLLAALVPPAHAHDTTGFWASEHAAGRAPLVRLFAPLAGGWTFFPPRRP